MCSGYSSSCRATLVADSSVLPLSQHPYGRVSGIGRSARPCLRKRPLPVLHGNVDVKARAASTATVIAPPPAETSSVEPLKRQVTFELAIHSHQPLNVLDIPDIDAAFPLYLDLQLASEESLTPPVTTKDWKWASSTGPSHPGGVEMNCITWTGSVIADASFGTPGALLITKTQATSKEHLTLYISTIDIPASGITFDCHSTVASEQGQRIFFANTPQLPSQTKGKMSDLREAELMKLRGEDREGPDPNAERVDTDRIYDYQDYCDLGAPWKGPTWSRPTLGGKELPFPRRLRSNRPTWIDPETGETTDFETAVKEDSNPILRALVELPPNCPYLPLDEQWNNTKERGFIGSAGASVLGLALAHIKTLAEDWSDANKSFVSLHAVDSMYQNSQLPPESRRDGSSFKFDDKFISRLKQDINLTLAAKLDQNSMAGVTAIEHHIERIAARFLGSSPWPQTEILETLTTFPVPKVRDGRSLDCFTDAEFGRQLVAGQHPCTIQAATKKWLDQPDLQPLREADIEGLLEGKTLLERIGQGNRMFCIDYVPGFLEFMDRVDHQNAKTEYDTKRADFLAKDRKQHAGRVLLYYTDEHYLKPVAIQLIVDPRNPKGTVYTPNDSTELWTLAKAIFGNLDFLYHQAASHYLIGHACQEPYIIALMRQVSAMHPVYKLMRPHFRNTLHVNAFGRVILTNAGTPIEALLTTGEYGMRLDSYIYDNVWSFDKSNFETDLIERGMVEMENGIPKRTDGRVTPSIDYPFAEDGLAIWYAMHKWFHDYLSLYYKDDEQVVNDKEITEFWKDVRDKGHRDKASGWIELTGIASLTDILTTIAFNGSVHHTACNFGNYDYSGYSPIRPSIIRKAMPTGNKDDPADVEAIDALKYNFEQEFLSYLTQPEDAMQITSTFRILSVHAENEEYLDSHDPEWIRDPQALEKLGAFVTAMEDLDKRIVARGNNTANKIGGNVGSRFLPYEILRPHSSQGMTGRGVPYSTSI